MLLDGGLDRPVASTRLGGGILHQISVNRHGILAVCISASGQCGIVYGS